jgi:hypothetical protein
MEVVRQHEQSGTSKARSHMRRSRLEFARYGTAADGTFDPRRSIELQPRWRSQLSSVRSRSCSSRRST